MSLAPTPSERLSRARGDLRLGLPVVLRKGAATVLVASAETLTDVRLDLLRGLGDLDIALTARRAETLKARVYDRDVARIALPEDADADWIRAMADPADDLSHPMKGPFRERRGGDPEFARLATRLAKSAHLLPAAVIVPVDAPPEGLTMLETSELDTLMEQAPHHEDIVTGRVPMALAEQGRVHVFRSESGGDEHVAVEIGQPPRDRPVLVRLHSACFTGDVLGSLKCDCGPQLNAALAAMGDAGAGILLYLDQEGRGIGLANKMRAYSLQDQGFDTVEANHRLGFEDDERDFRIGADILKRMGFTAARLMTNNPAKVEMMKAQGIDVVERVPLKVGRGPLNTRYLDVKARKSGHLL